MQPETSSKTKGSPSLYTLVETPAVTLHILEDVSPTDNEEEEELEDSIGRFIWPTAVPLLRHMLLASDCECDAALKKKKSSVLIVELGAGCGVLGMGLAAAAAAAAANNDNHKNTHVILTDHDDDWLERNVALNTTSSSEPLMRDARMEVMKLKWGDPQDIAMVQSRIQEMVAQIAVSSTSNNECNDDDTLELLIVASDILYNHDAHEALATTLHQLSSQLQLPFQQSVTTRILLGFPDRDNDEQAFMPVAREFFGDSLSPSKQIPIPIISDNRKDYAKRRRKKMDLRIIEFIVSTT